MEPQQFQQSNMQQSNTGHTEPNMTSPAKHSSNFWIGLILGIIVGGIVVLLIGMSTPKNTQVSDNLSDVSMTESDFTMNQQVNQQTPFASEILSPTESEPASMPPPSQEYVELVSGGGPNAPHEAVFQFLVPINPADITANNIFLCTKSASVGAPAGLDCDPANNSTWQSSTGVASNSDFTVDYNPVTLELRLADVNTSEPIGTFYVGCASCTTNVLFKGIHNQNGVLLPDKLIQIW